MKMFNDLAKKISDHHASAKKPPGVSMGAPQASNEEKAGEGTGEGLHSALAGQICPDCHATVKAVMAKHGMHSGEAAAPGLASHPAVAGE